MLILVLALVGLADSFYLASHANTGEPLLCGEGALSGCNTVATSAYSHLFGIPLAEFGFLFYFVVLMLALFELVLFDQLLRRVLQAVAAVGLLSSIYFVVLQAFVIKAFCIYCLLSATLTLGICIIAGLLEPLLKSRLAAQLEAAV